MEREGDSRLRSPKRAGAAAIVGIVMMAAALAAPWSPSVAGAQAVLDEPITWGVQPAGVDDARPAFHYDVVPGQVVEDVVRVSNFGDSPLALDVYARDAFNVAENGAFDVTAATMAPVEVGAWTEVSAQVVTVPARSSTDVPFRISVPADAEPGDHAGGIVAARSSQTGGAHPLRLDHRVGSRIYLHVDGARDPSLVVEDLELAHRGSLNPLGRGELSISYVVRNDGNIRLAADQWVEVVGLGGIGGAKVELEDLPELLPGGSFEGSAVVTDVLPGVRLTTSLHLETRSPAGPEGEVAASADLWAMPWTFLGVVALVCSSAGAALLVRGARRRKARPGP